MAKEVVTDLYRAKPKHINSKLKLSLPLPPSINHMYINLRGGGKRLTKTAENYVRMSRSLINLAIEEQHWIKPEKKMWLYLDLVFYFSDRRVRDSHNMLKLLIDVMQDLVFENDYYVMPNIRLVEYDEFHPRVEATTYAQTGEMRIKEIMQV